MRTDGRTDTTRLIVAFSQFCGKRLKMGVLEDYFRRKFPQQEGEEINVDGTS